VPAVAIIDLTPFNSYHHTEGDTVDKCSPESLAVVGRVVMVTLAELERVGQLLGQCSVNDGGGLLDGIKMLVRG